MSQQYNDYLTEHKNGLRLAFEWFQTYIPELFKDLGDDVDIEHQILMAHDRSKHWPEEYEAYDHYWYGKSKSFQVVNAYDYAWMHHIHNNPHHWQYWVFFKHDDPTEAINIFEMPLNYIIEMLCDWWSFGWNGGDIYELFTWYDERKKYIRFADKTRKIVEDILGKMKEILDSMTKPEAE